MVLKSNKNGILVEDCGKDCNDDTIAYKGLFI